MTDNDRTFVYALHIAATPEQVWQALTSSEIWEQYWNGEWRIESTWAPGAPLTFYTRDGAFFSRGEVVESDPPNRLTYTWPNPDEDPATRAPETLTWEIGVSGPGTVRLVLTHSRLSREFHERVGRGWAMILSSMKSLLETGTTLRFTPREAS